MKPSMKNMFQLTESQKRIWFEWKINPQSFAYNTSIIYKLSGALNPSVIIKALNDVTNKHESLRTYFIDHEGIPFQVILPEILNQVKVSSLCGTPLATSVQNITGYLNEPFNLGVAPLHRYALFKINTDEYIFGLTWHHIIIDASSVRILIKDISEFYNNYVQDKIILNETNFYSVLEVVQKEKETFSSLDFSRKLAHWSEKDLKFFKVNLPKRIFAKHLPSNGKRKNVKISNELSHLISKTLKQIRTTLFIFLMAAIKSVLYRYTKQGEITIGYSMSTRDSLTKNQVGFFINTLPLRTSLNSETIFSDLIRDIGLSRKKDHSFQNVPLTLITANVQSNERDAADSLFNIIINHSLSYSDSLNFQSINCDFIHITNIDPQTDFMIRFDSIDGIEFDFEYNCIDYENKTIEDLIENFLFFVQEIVKNPFVKISNVPLLSSQKKQQLLYEWNDTRVEAGIDRCIQELFEEQVERSPDNEAVVYEGKVLRYRELNEKANQLAHCLRSMGVGAESLVGLSVERSLEMVVGILGILKAGGAYVPLDPDYPKDRLEFMLKDSGADVLLTQEKLLGLYKDYKGKILCLDRDWGEIEKHSKKNPSLVTHSCNLAYVIYTSGSTGRPKGVMIEHKGLCNRIQWMQELYHLEASDCVLQKTSFSFDVSVWEFIWPLVTGSRLAVLPPHLHKDPAELIRFIQAEKATILHFVPSMLEAFLQNDKAKDCHSLRLVFASGESLAANLVKEFSERLPGTYLHNLYGPTEASIDVTYWDCSNKFYEGIVPIGRPIWNTSIYILDERLEPVPIGVSGEIYIGGVGLARGYLNRPELTAERFIENPFVSEDDKEKGINGRLYKTGDLGRYLPDGNIEYLGRVDEQVKIRGYRIELGEIESTLQEHPAVQSCVVTMKGEGVEDQRIVGYVVCVDGLVEGEEIGKRLDELREYVEQKLPSYMIPSSLVLLSEMPLTPNGKVDKKALPEPDYKSRGTREEYVEPRTEVEKQLAKIWRELLQVERVGIHDNFFKLGGHSLLATRVIARIRQVFHVEVPLREFFEHPTIVHLESSIVQLEQKVERTGIPVLRPMPRGEDVPLSFAQQRLWFIEQLVPDKGLYNIPVGLRLRGYLDIESLQAALDSLIKRHEILRTTIGIKEGPTQVICSSLNVRINLKNLEEATEADRYSLALTDYYAEAHKPFNFSKGPLFRINLLKLNEDDHILTLIISHVICDGWSIDLLLQDLHNLYRFHQFSLSESLPELKVQYADFAIWQREWLRGEVLERQLSYWREQLKDVPELLQFPTDKARPKELSYQGRSYCHFISLELSHKLKELSQGWGITLFTSLLGIFQTLLYRYSSQKDMVIGIAIANRHYFGVENLVGLFANTLALRIKFQGNPTFKELALYIQKIVLEGYEHQDIPFEQLVDFLQINRDLSRHPIFQVMFALENQNIHNIKLGNCVVEFLPFTSQVAKFDLTLWAQEQKGKLGLNFEYATDLFEERTIERLARHFEMLLEEIVRDPNKRVGELRFLTKEERQQLLYEWNDTGVEAGIDRCIQELFEEQVERSPDNEAVVYEGKVLRYRELNEKANQLAHCLRSMGVGAESLVGLSVERSLEMVVGILGILKAGGAYVPLDPDYPKDRLEFMLKDSGADVLLTQEKLLGLYKDYKGKILCLDRDWGEIEKHSKKNPSLVTHSRNLAYVIYTSGSTGRPKGVMIEHKGLVNFAICILNQTYVLPNDIILGITSISFDIASLEVYLPLIKGAKIALVPKEKILNAKALITLIQDFNPTLIQATPALWYLLQSENWKPRAGLKILSGGETLSSKIAGWLARTDAKVWNLYGPTETTIWSTLYQLPPIFSDNLVPIGRPIWNTSIYILDERLEPVPIGVSGEIYIGGVGLARGYLNRPELTAERFIENPFVSEDDKEKGINGRLYKTGDLGRYLPDGNIEYLGRVDEQVKIRGYRIELGEIESTLQEHPAVQSCVVTVKGEGVEDQRIVGYVVCVDGLVEGEEIGKRLDELREYVEQKLPSYMIPSSLVLLSEMPLTPNGKVDKKALPEPDYKSRGTREEYVEPRTEVEKQLAKIWRELLQVERVGIHDNFFKLGGHSLLATRVIARIRQVFHVEVPLREFFEHPTIVHLESSIVQLEQKVERTGIPVLRPMPRGEDVPLSFAQQRLWFIEQLVPDKGLYNIPVGLRLRGYLDIESLQAALDSLIKRHEILRTTIGIKEGQAYQAAASKSSFCMEKVDLRSTKEGNLGQVVKKCIQDEAIKPFNLEKGPLIRGLLLCLEENNYILIITIHHIAADGWSMGIFFKELSALYDAYLNNHEPDLPSLPIQYADFAIWQRGWLRDEVLEKQLSYWREQLKDIPELLQLSTDKVRPKELSYQGRNYEFELSRDLLDQIKALGETQGSTLFMFLLASFHVLLHRYSNQSDIVVGSVIANRQYAEVEGLIGFFVNTLPLRSCLSDNPTFIEHLNRVRGTTLSAYEHQDIPFEQLVDFLQVNRDLSRHPIFQVMFVLQNQEEGKFELEGLEVLPTKVDTQVSKFDLTLAAQEAEGSLKLSFEYATDLFEERTIERLARHFEMLLEEIVRDPNKRVGELRFLTKEERQQLLYEWNDTRVEAGIDRCIQELFEEQVERSPDNEAVVYEGKVLRYRELNEKANQLAHCLRSMGVGAESLVGLSVERSLEMVVGILGILKAGGAYVPLDPDYPKDRLEFMLKDSGADVLLTQEKLLGLYKDYKGKILCLDRDWGEIEKHSKKNPSLVTHSCNLAYVIYTSGSTGRPKGVMIEHKNVVRLMTSTAHWFHFTSNDTFTLFHSYAFDFSVWEIWGALLYGGKLIIVPYIVCRSPELFYKLLRREKITIVNQTPSAFQRLLNYEGTLKHLKKLPLRKVIFGGEALDPKILHSWFKRHGDERTQLINMYGITETTVHVTYFLLSQDSCINTSRSIIGQQIPDLKIYILDAYLQPVPIGVSGEIYIGGVGLARGYLNRPELTAERFIENPFVSEDDKEKGINGRLYKTGDLGRYLPDGNIEYLGRVDEQVKIRGYRIELGEIESTLQEHPAVQSCVVTMKGEGVEDQRIVGYVVCVDGLVEGEEIGKRLDELREYVEQKLPSYMIPSSLVLLSEMPLTPNGKVDKKALPEPDYKSRGTREEYVEPRTEVEKQLAKIWQAILKIDKIGVKDNFFDLGGDSLLSIRIVTKAKEVGIFFSVAELFKYPTINSLISFGLIKSNCVNTSRSEIRPFSLLGFASKSQFSLDIEDAYPLATLQEGMIFHSEYSSERSIYQDIVSYSIEAELKERSLVKAIKNLINRHEVLRTSLDFYSWQYPIQLVHKSVSVPVVFKDISHLSSKAQIKSINKWIEKERKKKINIIIPPLVRFSVHRMNLNMFQLGVTFHHAILDGWSVASMITELLLEYSSLKNYQLSNIKRPLSKYNHYIALEIESKSSIVQKNHWLNELKNIHYTKILCWPNIDKIKNTSSNKRHPIIFDQEISKSLYDFSQKLSVPIKSLFLAIHLKVLSLISNNNVVTTGLVTNGRVEEAEGDKVLGLFLNTLPFNLEIANESWPNFIKRVHNKENSLLNYRLFPLHEIIKLNNGNKLFDIIFNYINFHVYNKINKDIKIIDDFIYEETNFPLAVNIIERKLNKKYTIELAYNPTIICKNQIHYIGQFYINSINALLANHLEDVKHLSLLPYKERQQLLYEWNDTRVEAGIDRCIQELFEEQVERSPDNEAVVYEGKVLRYRELNEKANQLAHCLRSMGVGAESLVGLSVERSLEMVVGILGILKAGGAYVPLDPDYPKDRLEFMLKDSGADVLLTQEKLLGLYKDYKGKILCLDRDWGEIEKHSKKNPSLVTHSCNLAYVIYTSGSTGRPKGVMIEHKGLCNRIQWMQELYHLEASDCVLQKTSFSFDVSVWEFIWPLVTGSRLAVLPPHLHKDPAELIRFIQAEKATILHFVPSMLEAFLQNDKAKDCHSLRLVFASGESLAANLVKEFSERLPGTYLHNLYGPTEASIDVTYWDCSNKFYEGIVPIGRPIWNTSIYILDERLEPVPIGVSGEIYIGGVGLARGYLNRPELTAERFIENPFVSEDDKEKGINGRLYKTGDLGRYLPDGNIEYLGRVDEQVKIRGYRIELGEIESTLQEHPAVQSCVVTMKGEGVEDQRIVGYVVCVDGLVEGEEIGKRLDELREYVEQKLPSYMIPSSLVLLSEMPLTPNGKVDKKALPEPDYKSRGTREEYVEPRTEVEKQLAKIWRELLQVERVGIHDNFFKLGGHSLLATRVIARIRQVFHVEVPLREFFEHPTIVHLESSIVQLEQKVERTGIPVLRPMPRGEDVPLSFAQQRLWFIEQLVPDKGLYNIPVGLRLRGYLDIESLQAALDSLIKRHEILRTTIGIKEGQAYQAAASKSSFCMEKVDLRSTKEGNLGQVVKKCIQDEAIKPFNLEKGPLIRGLLLCLEENNYILIITIHHIAADGWSMGIFFKELSALYDAYLNNHEPDLPSLPIQYADFAIWQRGWLRDEVLEKQLSYWREQLKDIPELLQLSTDKVRPKELSYQGRNYEFELSRDLLDQIKALGETQGSTLFMFLLASFHVLLHRYSNQSDIVVGSVIANRQYAEVEGLIGFFVNTLPLRSCLSDNPTFIEHLNRVRGTTLSAYEHQDIPFEQLVDFLQVNRDLSRHPIFQVMFVLQNQEEGKFELEGLEVLPTKVDTQVSKFDLTLAAQEAEGSLKLSFEYATDLFEERTIERLARHFEMLLEEIVRDPNKRVGELRFLTKEERQQLLYEWNDTRVEAGIDRCIQELFEEQVERSPDNEAVVYEGKVLRYRELNEKANQLAHCLRSMGVGAESLVGLSVERSLEMVVGILGILKAGGAYVPLDPDYPKDRLEFMLKDSGADVLLTQEKLLGLYKDYKGKILCLDRDWGEIEKHSKKNPSLVTHSCNLAYVIYTSGSTGRPKGVMIEHKGLCNRIQWMQELYHLEASDCVLQKTSFSFDVSVWEFIWPLVTGSRLAVLPPHLHKDPAELIRFIQAEKATILHFVPSMLEAFLQNDKAKDCHSLRLVFASGESLAANLVKEFSERLPGTYLHNLYGPTEASIDVTYWDCSNKFYEGIVPIGRPIWNTSIYILDERLEPVPIGVSGEIYIGGVGLARGYLNRPELTAERFIENPFVSEDDKEKGINGRLYKTGDLGRYLPDGNIEYLGRVDEQVKIRGYRIELGEIESTLQEHPAVQSCVVTMKGEGVEDQRIVGYVVCVDGLVEGEEIGKRLDELREYVEQKLPSYMIPSSLVLLSEMPLTPNGKVDKKALPEPDYKSRGTREEYVEPRTEVEKQLAKIWRELLQVERVGIHDNFFKLGGHSLLATRVIARIRQVFHVEVPLREFFEHPTIVHLESSIVQLEQKVERTGIPVLRPMPRGEDVPLSFAQQRLWFIEQLVPDKGLYNIPVGLRLRGYLDIESLQAALDSLIKRHEILRTTIGIKEGQAYQAAASKSSFCMEKVDLRSTKEGNLGQVVKKCIQDEAIKPFNLEKGPLIRGLLLCLEENNYILIITIHHIAADGWSMGIFFKELSALYDAYLNNHEPDLPSLPIQYADFAIWQRGWLRDEVLEKQLSYWREQLKDIPELLQLSTDKVRPKELSYQGRNYEFELSRDLLDQIKALGETQGSTLFMFLLASFHVLLHRYSNQSDIVVGSVIANRQYAEVEGLIGFFVNTLPLRSCLSDNPTFIEHLNRVRGTTLSAYEHQDIPFEQLVDFLQVNRDLSRHPIFQVMFVLQNQEEGKFELEGLEVLPTKVDTQVSKFDLTLAAQEAEGSLKLSFEYATDLFEERTIERLARHFEMLLEEIVRDPNKRVGELRFLTKEERQQLLYEWNDTRVEAGIDRCIQELFEEQVERSPDNEAVVYEGKVLRYRELNEKANQLAHCLRSMGVGAESLVGLSVERSLEMVVGILGILKAGGAYVPLDPDYPKDRLEFMLKDSGADVLLTQEKLLGLYKDYKGKILCLDRDWGEIEKHSKKNPSLVTHSCNLAYVIYTSGSTGRPKGVMIEHKGLCNLVFSQVRLFEITSKNTVLQFASISFDASVSEWGTALTQGSTLRLITLEEIVSKNFVKYPKRLRALHLTLPPSIVRILSKEVLKFFNTLILAGERLGTDLVSHAYPCKLFNAYGPTEGTVCSTLFRYARGCPINIIGRPIWNTSIYILDERLEPVPIGVSGEIYIGGVGLARGYLNRPELTAERFIENPFVSEDDKEKGINGRLYKTGDLGRYLPDGNIEYLGRVDEQVKIRGYRIELGEIESTLQEHPAVQSCVVTVKGEGVEDQRIVGYVVCVDGLVEGEEIGKRLDELREYVEQKLPSYMIPSSLVLLSEMPLTPNGKVDKKALPEPDYKSRGTREEYVEPRTEVEKQLAKIWRELLQVERVGIHDNFFKLGGHSLLALRVLYHIKSILHEDIHLSYFLNNPTIKEMANIIENNKSIKSDKFILCVQPEGVKQPIFFIHPIVGLSFSYNTLAPYFDDRPIYAINNPNFGQKYLKVNSIGQMAELYINILKYVQAKGPYMLGGWSFGGVVALEMALQLEKEGRQVSNLFLIDSYLQQGHPSSISQIINEIKSFFDEKKDNDYFSLFENEIKNNLMLLKKYLPKEYSGKTTLIKASKLSQQEIREKNYKEWLPYLKNLSVYPIEGEHYALLNKKNSKILANIMKEILKNEGV